MYNHLNVKGNHIVNSFIIQIINPSKQKIYSKHKYIKLNVTQFNCELCYVSFIPLKFSSFTFLNDITLTQYIFKYDHENDIGIIYEIQDDFICA